MKKTISLLLTMTLMVAIIAVAQSITAMAAPGDPSALSAEVKLYAGRYDTATKVFTPLARGEAIAANEIIAIRIIPSSNYLVGASSYVVMFDKNLFTVMGNGSSAFIANTDPGNIVLNDDTMEYETLPAYSGNRYYDFTCTSFAGSTEIPDKSWPAGFAAGERYDKYKAIKVGTQANSNARSGGSPDVLAGDWLFQFRLKAVSSLVAGTDARIWTDARWFRSASNTNVECYIPKCLTGQLSSDASNAYNFNFKFSAADIKLPLAKEQEVTTAATITTTKPGTSTTKPGDTTPASTQSTKPGDTAASSGLTQTSVTPATTAKPVKVPVTDLDAAVEKAGIKDWDGNMANLTPEQKEAVQGYLAENGKDVEVRDDGFYYVETTVPGETATNADGSPVITDSSAEDGVTRTQKILVVVAAVAAVIVIGVVAFVLSKKKK